MTLLTVCALGVLCAVLVAPALAGASTSHAPRRMPDLVGKSRAEVYAIMRADQLYFTTRGPGSADGRWRVVVAQTPRPGTLVAWHAQATLTTSLKSAPARHADRRMPALVGKSKAQVLAAMRRAQLYFHTVGPGSATGRWRRVVAQSPRAGTLVAWHAQTTLRVTTARPRHVLSTATVKKKRRPTTTTTVHRTPVTTTTGPKPTTTTTSTSTTTTTTYPGETTTTSVTTTTVHATTTTVKPRPVVKPKPHRYRIGDATWYYYVPGRCATWYLPYGTRLTIRDLDTGKTIHCVDTDREGAHGDRVVDLSSQQFSQLAPLSRGVIRVKVSW